MSIRGPLHIVMGIADRSLSLAEQKLGERAHCYRMALPAPWFDSLSHSPCEQSLSGSTLHGIRNW